ncbi:MAG: CDP-glycerol glycerophosphotransferase family protein [bacterium]|nr:CDP-glycerol glycerophosphotransferase family protein [bacterium]
MKTIFVTLFNGVAVKNILRTDVIKTILNKSDARLVFFMKDKVRIEYYRREYNERRFIYEAVSSLGVRGFCEKFLSHLKFYLLHTATTDERVKLLFEAEGSYVRYYFRRLAHSLIANRFFVNVARWMDYRFVADERFDIFFEKYKPDLIVCTDLFDDIEIGLLRTAKRSGIKTIGYINTWDRVTARCILRLVPDTLIVFNEQIKKALSRYHYIDQECVKVSGIPQYDRYFTNKAQSREEFSMRRGVDPKKKIIVYAPIGATFSSSDWEIIDLLTALISQGKFKNDPSLFVRFAPNDFIDERELKKRPTLRYDKPGIRFSSTRGVDWDMTPRDLEGLHDTLSNADLLISYASSIAIDAAILDKPIININFELPSFPAKEDSAFRKLPTKIYKWAHYREALATGGIRMVQNIDELIIWVNRYLEDPLLDADGRRALRETQCPFSDGRSAERIAGYILEEIA